MKKNGNFEKGKKSLFYRFYVKHQIVLQKDSKIEKINVTMIMVAKIQSVHVGKIKIIVMREYWPKHCIRQMTTRRQMTDL